MFAKTGDLEESHKLSSLVFGIMSTRHTKGNFERETDSISSSISDEQPSIIEVKPRIREFKENNKKAVIEDKTELKKNVLKNI